MRWCLRPLESQIHPAEIGGDIASVPVSAPDVADRAVQFVIAQVVSGDTPRSKVQSDARYSLSPLLMIHALILLLFVTGCGSKVQPVTLPPVIVTKVEVVEKLVPTVVHREPPEALLAALKPPLPVFVAPTDPEASSALTPEGERLLLGLLEELLQRIKAWEAWAQAK